MTMIVGHCSNPGCHRPYANGTMGNYAEVITLREMTGGNLDYFVISICTRCLLSANDIMIKSALRDAVDYEIKQNNSSIMLTKEQKKEYRAKHERYKFIAWGRNREELDQKLAK